MFPNLVLEHLQVKWKYSEDPNIGHVRFQMVEVGWTPNGRLLEWDLNARLKSPNFEWFGFRTKKSGFISIEI